MRRGIEIGVWQFIRLRIAVWILNGFIKTRVVGGFNIVPWGIEVKKEFKDGKTYWIIDGDIEDLNLIRVKPE